MRPIGQAVVNGREALGQFTWLGLQSQVDARQINQQVSNVKILIPARVWERQTRILSQDETGREMLYAFVSTQPFFQKGQQDDNFINLIVREIIEPATVTAIKQWQEGNK